MLPTVHYNMGGIPTNFHGEVVTKARATIPTSVVPGLMAVGEAACVSVHGANRLGSNSLIDLVVFGRAAGLRCAETLKPGAHQPRAEARADRGRTWPASTACATPPAARPTAVLRLDDADGDAGGRRGLPHRRDAGERRRAPGRGAGASMADIKTTDRGLIWNTDLVETLEFDNLIGQAVVTVDRRAQPHRKAAAPTPARTSPTATTPTG